MTVDRRRKSDKRVIIIQGVTALIAVAALVFSLWTQHGEQVQARKDGCHLLRSVIIDVTPKAKLAAAHLFIRETPLRNCNYYGEHP